MERLETSPKGALAPRKGPNWIYITPMFLMGLPLVRIAFRRNPVVRDRVFWGYLMTGFFHHAYLIARADDEGERSQEVYVLMPPKLPPKKNLE